jgi:hypothetical protein
MLVQSKGQHAIKVDVLEPHRRQVTDGLTVHTPFAGHAPTIQRTLHLMGVPSHDEVGHEGQRTGLGPELLCAPPASGAAACAANLTLQGMGTLVVVELSAAWLAENPGCSGRHTDGSEVPRR